MANTLLMISTAAFDALYARRPGAAAREPVEMLTTAARCAAAAQCRAKAGVSKKVPVTFTAKTRSQAAAGMSSSVPSG